MTDPLALPPRGSDFSSSLAFVWRWLLLGGATGAVSGFLIGGVGGRLAMFVLRLTSSDSVRGVESDDGFTIGRFSGETGFLLAITTALGMIVGIACVVLRSQLTGRAGAVLIVLTGGALGAAAIIKPDGVDFTRLGPLPLACVMFTIIPIAATAMILWLIGRWRQWWWTNRRRTLIACSPWILAAPSFFVSVPAIIVALAVASGAIHLPLVRTALTNRVGQSIATLLATTITVLASIALVGDLTKIL